MKIRITITKNIKNTACSATAILLFVGKIMASLSRLEAVFLDVGL